MREIWAKLIAAKGFKKLPKSNKSPNLVTLYQRYFVSCSLLIYRKFGAKLTSPFHIQHFPFCCYYLLENLDFPLS